MSATTIELKIASARKQSEILYKKDNSSWQQKVDSLLDRMNELNGLLGQVHTLLLSLNFELERDSIGFKESQNAPEGLKALTTVISKILILVRKSDLYPGVKTIYSTIKCENNYLRELLQDRKIGMELDEDPEMKQIIAETIKAAKK